MTNLEFIVARCARQIASQVQAKGPESIKPHRRRLARLFLADSRRMDSENWLDVETGRPYPHGLAALMLNAEEALKSTAGQKRAKAKAAAA